MDTLKAFAMGEANRGKEMMVFDWDKAASLIKEFMPKTAEAGLEGDWEWTGGVIYTGGKVVDADGTYTYLASTWATPQLRLDGKVVECYIMKSSTDWDAHTYWPTSALNILFDGL